MEDESNRLSDRIKWLKRLMAGIPKTAEALTSETLEIWSRRLVRVPLPHLVAAANILVERCIFFPSLAEILQVCRELHEIAEDRQWKRNIEDWKEEWSQDRITGAEAKKMLQDVTEKTGVDLVAKMGVKK